MKKKREKHEPPVPVILDERGKKRSDAEGIPEKGAQAPDGVSGDWG